MKIAYLIPGTTLSGGVAIVCQHVNRLLARGHTAFMVTQSGSTKLDWFPDQKASIVLIENYPQDTDILVATGWSTSFAVARLPARKKFYFVQSDETRFHPKESPFRYLTAFSYLLDFNYITEARWIQKWLAVNFGQQAELIPNGLDETIWYPATPIEPKTDKPRVLLEGAIGLPYKGMEDAFNVIKELDVEVWCVSSSGAPRPEWRCDRFFNEYPMKEMHKIYSSCDILLKMSRMEGFFGPPMEMMACGGAVVVGKVSGYDEYIIDGYNALVVEQGDIKAARSAILRLVNDPELKKKLIDNGKKTAAEWKWEPSIDKLEQYLINTLNGKKPESIPVREDLHNAALSYQEMLAAQTDYFVATHPIETLLLRLRKNKFARRLAEIIAFFYREMKNR